MGLKDGLSTQILIQFNLVNLNIPNYHFNNILLFLSFLLCLGRIKESIQF